MTHRAGSAPPFPALPLWSRLLILAIAVVHFTFGAGPVWQHPWDVDASILWSYLPIPFLVLGALAMARRLRWSSLFLHTVEIVSFKLIITASILIVLWTYWYGLPAKNPLLQTTAPRPVQAALPPPRPTPPPSVIPEEQRGAVEGRVVLPGGAPAAGALVHISAGLEGLNFAAPESAVELRAGGEGITPKVIAAQINQEIVARSADGRLHTLLLSKPDRSWVLNYPLLGTGQRSFRLEAAHGWVEMRCAVHGDREALGHLLVSSHPFFTAAAPDGTFQLRGVPVQARKIAAFLPGAGRGERAIELRPGGKPAPAVEIALQPADGAAANR